MLFGRDREKPKQPAQNYAIWLLSRWDYSAATLRRKLVNRGYSTDEADAAVAAAIQAGYQSDARYAGVKARGTQGRAGDRKIELVLKSKGIDAQIAKEQIAALDPEVDRAIRAAAKFRKYVEKDGWSIDLANKVRRSLASKGFSGASIKVAINELKTVVQEMIS